MRRAGRRALLADLDQYADLAPDREVGSVFFGGGTPSLMPPETVGGPDRPARALGRRRPISKSRWRPIRIRPRPIAFAALAAAGVNRLSLGVQALDPAALRFLGRQHDRDEAIAAIGLARDIFSRVSRST